MTGVVVNSPKFIYLFIFYYYYYYYYYYYFAFVFNTNIVAQAINEITTKIS